MLSSCLLLLQPAIQFVCSQFLDVQAASDLRPIRLDVNEGVKHRTHQHLASEAVSEGWVKPPQGSMFHHFLTLAGGPQLLQGKTEPAFD